MRLHIREVFFTLVSGVIIALFVLVLSDGEYSAQPDMPPTPDGFDTLRGLPIVDAMESASVSPSSPQVFAGCANVTGIPKAECEILLTLYNITNGAGWKNKAGWKQTNTPCTWYGITCTDNRVTHITLDRNNLQGQIPPQLGQLANLKELHLNRNNLGKTIPPQLSKLKNLVILNLGVNNLQGQIPPQFGKLSNLVTLNLQGNNISGTIPPELGNLTNLETLILGFAYSLKPSSSQSNRVTINEGRLSRSDVPGTVNRPANRLHGTIPPELGQLTNLVTLILNENQLTGTIPVELGQLTNLVHLDLGTNQLEGAIPSELGQLSNLIHLQLDSNQLSGSIPSELTNLTNLVRLRLSRNQLTGAVLPELGSLSNLEILILNRNQLNGTIPTELANLTNLKELYLDSNQLSGSIPPELGQLTNLERLYLNNNQLSGTIPTTFGSLTNLRQLILSHNELEGAIPPELGQLSNLRLLFLEWNRLSGTIPAELGQLSNSLYLQLESNRLSGDIPASFANLLIVSSPSFDFNALTASDPILIWNLNSRNPDWFEPQTTPPTSVNVTVEGDSQSLVINWTPMVRLKPYLDAGYYQVGCTTTSSGPYDSLYFLYTADMHTTQATFSALPDDTYYCAVRTFTPAHADNKNDVWSAWSAEGSGTVAGAVTVQGDDFAAPIIVSNLNSQFWSLNAANATADATFPAPSCAPDINPAVHPGIFFQLPVDLPSELEIAAGGLRDFNVRDADLLDTVIAIYTGDTLQTLVETACDDDSSSVGGGSHINLSAFTPDTTYSAVVWLRDVGVNGAGTDGLIFEVSGTQLLTINGDFSVESSTNATMPHKWNGANLGSSRLLCDKVGKPSRAYSTPCAFQLVAGGAQAPVLQQVIQSVTFPKPISEGTLQTAAYLQRLSTTGKAKIAFEVTYTNGKKVTKVRQIPAGNSGGVYELVSSPLLRVQKTVKRVRVYVTLEGSKGKLRVDDVKLYYIP